MKNDKLLISIVTPFYNEEESIDEYFRCLEGVFKSIESIVDYEVIAVDDGSRDATYDILRKIAGKKHNLKIIKLSRNFGKEIALTAGLDHAGGDAVIPMDADLQDSPEIVPEMIKKWQEGYKVVMAQRIGREDPLLKKLTSALFYKLAGKIMDSNIPKDIGDFRLIDKAALNSIKQMREKSRFMRGILSWVGYKTTIVTYKRSARAAGETKYNYRSMTKYALDGFFSFSTFPIRLITYCGLLISICSFLYGATIIVMKIFFNSGVPGYASMMSVILFLSGMNFFFIGIIGEYVGRIFTEVKNRPLYIVEDLVNNDKSK